MVYSINKVKINKKSCDIFQWICSCSNITTYLKIKMPYIDFISVSVKATFEKYVFRKSSNVFT